MMNTDESPSAAQPHDAGEYQRPPVAEPPEMLWTWAVLGAILLLFVWASLVMYFKSNPESQGFALQREKIEKYIRNQNEDREPSRADLATVKTTLEPYRTKHPRAERYYAIASYLEKSPLSEDEAHRLNSKLSAENAAVATALGATPPTKEQLASLDRDLSKDQLGIYVKKEAHRRAGSPIPEPKTNPILILLGAAAGLGVIVVGVLVLATYLNGVTTGRIVPKGWTFVPPTLRECDSMALRAAVVLFFGYAVPPGQFLPEPYRPLGTLVVFFAALAVPIGGHSLNWKTFFGERLSLGSLGTALAAYVGQLPLLLGGAMLATLLMLFLPSSFHPMSEQVASGKTSILLLVLEASVMAPLIEETVFRGLICQALVKRLGDPTKAILLSSLMFAAIHPQGIPMWVALGTVGATSCIVLRQTKCLWACMVFHGIHNFVLVYMGTLLR